MNPQDSTAGNLDPQAVALSKAIRQVESGGNPTRSGASGEYGAYQWEPATWDAMSKAAGVNVPLEHSSLEQQNQVAYNQIKQWKDQGYNPGQIASMWNAGTSSPNAYLENHVGVNSKGVSYNTPEYAKKVATYYQQFKQESGPTGGQSTGQIEQTQNEPQKKNLFDTISNAIQTIFPGKEIGEAIGTEVAKLLAPENQKQYITPGPTGLQVAGDVANAGLMLAAPELGGESALGRIGATAALGAGSGLASSLAGGETDPMKLAESGATGGIAGGALGSAGEVISKALNYLPYRMARTFLPGTSKETAEYAVQKGLGAPATMFRDSNSSLSNIGSSIEGVLNHPDVQDFRATAQDIFPYILQQYPNAGLTNESLADILEKIAPLQKGLIDKLQTEGLNPLELNQLKTAIGKGTYKTVFDEPAVKANKDIGNAAYAGISKWFEQKVPDAAPLFQEYSKELQLNKALKQAVRRGEKKRPITLLDLVSILSGGSLGGPLGSVGGLILNKALTDPTVNLTASNLLAKTASPTMGALMRQGLVSGITSNQGRTQ